MRPNDVAFFENYISNHPDSAYLPKLAAIYIENGELELAVDCCKKELTVRPHSPYGQFLWGLVALKTNNLALAIEKFQATIQSDPSFLAAYYQLVTIAENYLDEATYQYYLHKISQLNPLDKTIGSKLSHTQRLTPQTPSPAVTPSLEPEPSPAVSTEAQWEPTQVIADVEPAPTTLPSLSEEEAHLGPIEAEESQPTEPTDMETPGAPTTPIAGAPPSSLTELFQKLKTQSLEEIQAEASDDFSRPGPAAAPAVQVPPEPTFTVPESSTAPAGAGEIAQLFEKLRTTPIDQPQGESGQEAQPSPMAPPSTVSTVEPNPISMAPDNTVVTAPTQPPIEAKKTSSRRKKEPKGAGGAAEGEVTIKFPIPTWTLVEVLKKQQLYSQALEIIAIIEKKSQKPSDLEKARQNREEIERLMAEE